MDSLSKVLELIKLPIIYISAFLLSSSCFIFMPDSILINLGVIDIRNKYRSYIGIIFILSLSIILVNIIAYFLKVLRRKYIDYIWRRAAIKTLRNLNNAEKAILLNMMISGTYSKPIDITSGCHNRLEHYIIIYRASNLSTIGTLFTFNMQPWVVDYIRKNEKILA
ncbi:MAG: superinfection exclusion B family protein [Sedimentibacter sp.]|nr:superinfection exclusion B family protein [Sedimentibacter sp.]